jgi:hypothetical protein
LFSHEDFMAGQLRMQPPPQGGERVLYRGWMLAPEHYRTLAESAKRAGAQLFTSPEDYILCHHLPCWYPLLAELTPPTLVCSIDDDYLPILRRSGWEGFFVKDFVKSLNTTRGSIARTPEEVPGIVAQIARFRGGLEGGICVRRREDLIEGSERRFFVLGGEPWEADAQTIPQPVLEAAARIRSPFFSVDVAQRSDGALRIIEIGDGQVSDRKHWTLSRMALLLAHACGLA